MSTDVETRFWKLPEKATLAREVVAGVTVFFTVSYVAFAQPAILSQSGIGMDRAGVFASVCILAGLGSILMGVMSNSPSAVTSGMGLNAYFAQVITHQLNHDWQLAMRLSAVAGGLFLLLTLTGVRRELMKAMPRPLILAVKGGIGALLVGVALKFVGFQLDLAESAKIDYPTSLTPELGLAGAGLAVLIFGEVYLRDLAKGCQARVARIVQLFAIMSPIVSIVVVSALAAAFGVPSQESVSANQFSPWAAAHSSFWAFTGADFHHPATIPFIAVLLYVMMVDIAGSPYEILDLKPTDPRAQRGWLVDSSLSVFAPMLGATSPVCAAESHAGKLVGGKTGIVAIVTGGLFLAIVFVPFVTGLQIGSWLAAVPRFALTPVLFYLGINVIAEAFDIQPNAPATEGTNPELPFEDSRRNRDVFPPAVVTFASPFTSLENALGLGFATYVIVNLCNESAKGRVAAGIMTVLWFVYVLAR